MLLRAVRDVGQSVEGPWLSRPFASDWVDAPGAGPLLQGGLRARHRAPALPLQRAEARRVQRPLRPVQADAAELPAPLAACCPEDHP